jgi:acyl-CoA synthetase (NDP forming)
VLVDDEREMVDALTVLSRMRLRPDPSPGLGIVTAQAGPGLLLADRAGADGVRLPELSGVTRAGLEELLPPPVVYDAESALGCLKRVGVIDEHTGLWEANPFADRS